MDVFIIIALALFAMRAFKETGVKNFFGWCLATFFFYGIVKGVVMMAIMWFTSGIVFPVPNELYLQLPGAVCAVLIVGAIYLRCWKVVRAIECQKDS